MYFYAISNGEYSDYSDMIIYHDKKFTNKQFAEMYNKSIKSLGGSTRFGDAVAEEMRDLFGFVIVKQEFEINVTYGKHEEIDLNEISEHECFYEYENWGE